MDIDPFAIVRACEDAYLSAREDSDEQRHARALLVVASVAAEQVINPNWTDNPYLNPAFRGPEGRERRNEIRRAAASLDTPGREPQPATPQDLLRAIAEGRLVSR
jgi:hypothetical protein